MLDEKLNRPYAITSLWSIFLISFSFFTQAQNSYYLFDYGDNMQIELEYKVLLFNNGKYIEKKSNTDFIVQIERIDVLDSIFVNLNSKYYKVNKEQIKNKKIFIKQVEKLNTVSISTRKRQKKYTLKSFSNNICKSYGKSGKVMNLINMDSISGNFINSVEFFVKKQPKRLRGKSGLRIGVQIGNVNSLENIEVTNLGDIVVREVENNFKGWLEFDMSKVKLLKKYKYLAIIIYFYDYDIIIPCPSNKSMRERIFISTLYRPITDRGRIIEDRWFIYNKQMKYPTSNPFNILPLKLNTINF